MAKRRNRNKPAVTPAKLKNVEIARILSAREQRINNQIHYNITHGLFTPLDFAVHEWVRDQWNRFQPLIKFENLRKAGFVG